MLSRKYYRSIAEILKDHKPLEDPDAWDNWRHLVIELAEFMARDNQGFDKERFYEACGGIEP